ncbi:MAG: DUF3570 domain-containing protein [Gammaproteobacteria bacterium]|nr:DUF3570 domain-containing protein [Gammaproteobacteria bacterium]
MQLETTTSHFRSLREALTLATCSLLASGQSSANEWQLDSALLYYSENDRVSVVEPLLMGRRDLNNGDQLNLSLVVDSMTGASPNGATTTNQLQTFTSPSGKSLHQVNPGELPANSFRDQSLSVAGGYTHGVAPLLKNSIGGNFSAESDYSALGFTDTLLIDLENRLTTFTLAAGATFAFVDAAGATPVPLSRVNSASVGSAATPDTVSEESSTYNLFNGEGKESFDLLFGITQVLSPRTLVQLNYSYTRQQGYLNDPYKIISEIDPKSGDTLGYFYESRPDNRNSHALFGQWIHHLQEDVVRLSYRYYRDAWGVNAHTAEIKYRYELGNDAYLQPQLRLYQQSAADFYRHSLPSDLSVNEVSADLRLAKIKSRTIGLKFGMPLGESLNGKFSVRLEQMLQTGDASPASAIGSERNYNLHPDLEATIIQFGYSLRY